MKIFSKNYVEYSIGNLKKIYMWKECIAVTLVNFLNKKPMLTHEENLIFIYLKVKLARKHRHQSLFLGKFVFILSENNIIGNCKWVMISQRKAVIFDDSFKESSASVMVPAGSLEYSNWYMAYCPFGWL